MKTFYKFIATIARFFSRFIKQNYSSIIATGLTQPALPPRIFIGKQATLNP
jgi:hypothetical protein